MKIKAKNLDDLIGILSTGKPFELEDGTLIYTKGLCWSQSSLGRDPIVMMTIDLQAFLPVTVSKDFKAVVESDKSKDCQSGDWWDRYDD